MLSIPIIDKSIESLILPVNKPKITHKRRNAKKTFLKHIQQDLLVFVVLFFQYLILYTLNHHQAQMKIEFLPNHLCERFLVLKHQLIAVDFFPKYHFHHHAEWLLALFCCFPKHFSFDLLLSMLVLPFEISAFPMDHKIYQNRHVTDHDSFVRWFDFEAGIDCGFSNHRQLLAK